MSSGEGGREGGKEGGRERWRKGGRRWEGKFVIVVNVITAACVYLQLVHLHLHLPLPLHDQLATGMMS